MKPKTLTPQILILASKFDLAYDYVVSHLKRHNASYFRVNSEDLDQFAITSFPTEAKVVLKADHLEVRLERPHLKAIYFRRGFYPREAFTP